MDLFKKCYEFTAVNEAKAAGIYPYCPVVSDKQTDVTIMSGNKTIMIGSSNYLGLSGDERVIEAAKIALDKYGTGVTGTRLFNGTTDIHLELEAELAGFTGKEACTVFPTGFQSNVAIIGALAGADDLIFGDDTNHESILTGIKASGAQYIPYPHDDYDALEEALLHADSNKGKLIIVDGVFSYDGSLADVPRLVELKNKYGARLMIDDSHGFGSVGNTGRGTCEYYGLMDEVDVFMATFSKCLVSVGGFVAAEESVVNYISHTAVAYTNTAALPPVNAAAALAALNILKEEPWRGAKARENAEYVREKLRAKGVRFADNARAPIVSIYTKDEISTYVKFLQLMAKGIYTNVLVDNGVIRTCYNALHTQKELDYIVEQFVEVFAE